MDITRSSPDEHIAPKINNIAKIRSNLYRSYNKLCVKVPSRVFVEQINISKILSDLDSTFSCNIATPFVYL